MEKGALVSGSSSPSHHRNEVGDSAGHLEKRAQSANVYRSSKFLSKTRLCRCPGFDTKRRQPITLPCRANPAKQQAKRCADNPRALNTIVYINQRSPIYCLNLLADYATHLLAVQSDYNPAQHLPPTLWRANIV